MKNIGLVGLGFIGRIHLEAFRQLENCQVKTICTRKKVDGEFQGGITQEFADLLTDSEIDIIDICLPTYLHEEYIIKAAESGKHIICEKPLTLTLESAERIMEAVRKNNVKLFVGQVLRFWPEYQAIKSYCESEQLQNIEIVHAKRLGQVPQWSDWFQDPAKSGGALFDLHIHDIDFVYYLLGEVDSLYSVGNKNKHGAWDHVMTTLTFKNKSKAFVEASQRMPAGYPFTMSFRAQAKNQALDFHVIAGENIENINGAQHHLVHYRDGVKSPVEVEKGDAFQNELKYFVNCIERNHENIVVPLADVLYVLKLLRAIAASLETGHEVRM